MKEISLKADQRYSASVKICQDVKTMKKDYKYCQDDTCFVWTSRLQNSSAMCPSDIKWSWVTASQYLTQRQSAPGQRSFNSQVRITCSDSRLHKRISAGLFHATCVRKTMANVTPAPKACTEQRFDRMTCFPRFFHFFRSRSPFPSLFLLAKTREHHIVVQKTDAGCMAHLEGIMMMNPRCIFPVSACAWLPHVMLPPSSSMSEQGFSITKERVLHLCFMVQIFTAKLNLAKAYKNWNAINNGCLFMIPGSRRISHLRYVSLVLSCFCILVKCRKILI